MDERGLRRPDGGAIRVLVVDDELSLSDLLSMALRYEGWDVRAAADGSSAVRVAREFRPDAPPLRTDTGGVATSPGGCGMAVVLSVDALTVTAGHWRFDAGQRRRYRAAVDGVESGETLVGLLRRLAASGLPADPEGELQILPRGWEPDHPRVSLARRRGLQVVRRWELGPWVATPEPLERVRSTWRAAAPLVEWLDTHVGPASPRPAPPRRSPSAPHDPAALSPSASGGPAATAGTPTNVVGR